MAEDPTQATETTEVKAKAKKPIYKRVWFWVIVVLVVVVVFGGSGSGDEDEATSTTDETVAESTETADDEEAADEGDEEATDTDEGEAAAVDETDAEEEAEVEEAVDDSSEDDVDAVTTYSAGGYRVGTDIPAGEYKLTCSSSVSAYYVVYPSTSETELTDILSNDNFDGSVYVTLSEGQYIEVTRATFVAVEDAEASTDLSLSGTYKVGIDLDAGEYKLTVDESSSVGYGYYAILSSTDVANGTLNNIVSNDNFEGSVYVTLEEGQYLTISRASVEPAS